MFVQDVMTTDPTTVTPDTTLKHAAELLAEHRISSMPVLDDAGRLCGVVSEADLIREAFVPDPRAHLIPHEEERTTQLCVDEVMTPHAITVHPSTDISDVADLMTSSGVKSLPVVDDDWRLVGVVSRSDLVQVRARADDSIESEVDARLSDMGHGDWVIDVTDGTVHIEGPTNDVDRSMARIIASTVPGVVKVTV